MWIAKPVSQLTQNEMASWLALEPLLPLSQKLCWARAIESVQGRSFLVFSPDEKVGGLVFCTAPQSFECINGPFLDWDDPATATRQIATFAQAVSRLSPRFQSLTVRPRWSPEQLERRLENLPIAPTQVARAATVVIPIQKDLTEQFNKLSGRLRRTIRVGQRKSIQTCSSLVTPTLLAEFVPKMAQFATSQGFITPPLDWFLQLTKGGGAETESTGTGGSPQFWLISSSYSEAEKIRSLCQILICIEGPSASYLFGYENRAPGIAGSISTSAAAQWEALTICIKEGVHQYDLNGYMPEADSEHPYYGVSQFKKQFNGEVVNYRAPEFVIC